MNSIQCCMILAVACAALGLLWLRAVKMMGEMRKKLRLVGNDRAHSFGNEDELRLQMEGLERENEELRNLVIKQALIITPLEYERLYPKALALTN